MKKIYKISIIYTLIMAIGMFICNHFCHVSYVDSRFIETFLPVLILLTPFSVISFIKSKKEIENSLLRYKLFMIVFVPVVLLATFTIVEKFEFSYYFSMRLLGAFLVGINEELLYRGVIFTNIIKEKGLIRGIFISALAFSLLHVVNIFGGLTVSQMFIQLINTFFVGIFFAVVYFYTKNIWLLIIFHGLWDYILFSEINKLYPVIDFIFLIFMFMEVIIAFILIKNLKNV